MFVLKYLTKSLFSVSPSPKIKMFPTEYEFDRDNRISSKNLHHNDCYYTVMLSGEN